MDRNHSGTDEDREPPELETTTGLADDDLYRALASTRRRRLLYHLLDEDRGTVDELAAVLSGWRATETGRMVSRDDYGDIVIGLLHVDLPVLADAGLVSVDHEEGVVSLEPIDGAVADLVRSSVEAEPAAEP